MTTNPKRAGGVPQALVCVELKELAVMLGKQQVWDRRGSAARGELNFGGEGGGGAGGAREMES